MTNKRDNKRDGPGRPPHEPTAELRERVETLSGYGVAQEDIAAICGFSVEVLSKHYRAEWDAGKAKANAQVGQSLFQKAVGGDVAAAIWWSKAQMRWRETKQVEGKLDMNLNLSPERVKAIAREILRDDDD